MSMRFSKFIATPDSQRLELMMSTAGSTATRGNQSLTSMLTINKKTADPDSNSSVEDSENSSLSSLESYSSDHDHDDQVQIIGQTATHYLISFIDPSDAARYSWVERDDFDESLVERWQEIQQYVKPYATQRAIEDGLWYVEIGEMSFIVKDALYDMILSSITANHGEALNRQMRSQYNNEEPRMVVGHDETYYLVLSRVPGHELEASWVARNNVDGTIQADYWAWHDALESAMGSYKGDEQDFRPDLLMLKADGVFVAMPKKIASEVIMSVIGQRHSAMLEGAKDEV